jgi:glycogen debranching enzyme
MGIVDIHDALIIREGDSFLVADENGNVPPGNDRGLGLYHADMRHLSVYHFFFHTERPVVLLSTAEAGFASEHVLTNPRLYTAEGTVIPHNSIEVRRQRTLLGSLEETLQVRNFSGEPVTVELHLELGADFADIFEVRGYEPKRRGELLPPIVTLDDVTYEYRGLDGLERRTTVSFTTRPALLSAAGAVFRVRLEPRAEWSTTISVALQRGKAAARSRRVRDRFQAVTRSYERWLAGCTQVATDNEFFDQVLERSFRDLRMLWDETTDGSRFIAAGTPWFDALFGRDSVIVSLQTLPWRPEIARETLRSLARRQGRRVDFRRDEEPGKILHELRRGELSRSGELPYSAYFGTVDATPLFLLLAAEYYNWTGDLRTLRELLPNLLAALRWLERYGDLDGDGYIEYEKRAEKGLVNQGWKDSHDAIIHTDGSLADPPIGLVEVQGYVYAAKRRLAPVLEALSLPGEARRLATEARRLRARAMRDFWLADEQYFALALDGGKRPCGAIASNAGHALWAGLATRERARHVVSKMLADDLFSGWGIRTIGRESPRYNPLGYHLGTVWPHDNAIAAFGFKMYGFEEELNEVATALFEAALTFPYYRLPELFGGQPRTTHGTPVPYPVACRPQAWAAGAFPMLLQAMLGLRADAGRKLLEIVRPRLPYWLERVHVRGLRVGRAQVDLLFQRRGPRTHVEVRDEIGEVRVQRASHWRL